jgi:hypothetical protein
MVETGLKVKGKNLMDKNTGPSMKAERDLIEMSKTMDLATIVKKTGRKPEAILRTARRLGVSIKR